MMVLLGHQDASQGQFRNQINAINDAVRQLGGKPLVAPGDTEVNDPLNLGYVLYVNPDIGSDKIVYGDYASSGASDSEALMRLIESCGASGSSSWSVATPIIARSVH